MRIPIHYLNNSVFMWGSHWLIVGPWKFNVLKTNICLRSLASRANMHVTWSVIFKLVRIKENLVVNCNNYCWYVWIANVCWSILTWASDGSLVSSLTNVSPPYSHWKSQKNTLLKWSPCQEDNHLLHSTSTPSDLEH